MIDWLVCNCSAERLRFSCAIAETYSQAKPESDASAVIEMRTGQA
jgi:hypothetical protein